MTALSWDGVGCPIMDGLVQMSAEVSVLGGAECLGLECLGAEGVDLCVGVIGWVVVEEVAKFHYTHRSSSW